MFSCKQIPNTLSISIIIKWEARTWSPQPSVFVSGTFQTRICARHGSVCVGLIFWVFGLDTGVTGTGFARHERALKTQSNSFKIPKSPIRATELDLSLTCKEEACGGGGARRGSGGARHCGGGARRS